MDPMDNLCERLSALEHQTETLTNHTRTADVRLPEAAGVVDDAAAFDAAVHVLDAHAPAGDAPIGGFLRACEGSATRLPGRHDDLYPVQCECQETQILE
jgi:hypothetical protein